MRGRRDPQVTMLAFIDLESRVPPDHPLRTIKVLADGALEELSPELDRMYAEDGRPSMLPLSVTFIMRQFAVLTRVWNWSRMTPTVNKRRIQTWEILNSEQIFVAVPWIEVSVQRLRLPSGQVIDDYHQIGLPDFVVIFATTTGGKAIMERLYKHGVGKVTLTLPSGVIEPGEEPLEAAKRELLEETGYSSSQWESLGSLMSNGNYGCGTAHLFIARKARRLRRAPFGPYAAVPVDSPHSNGGHQAQLMDLRSSLDALAGT